MKVLRVVLGDQLNRNISSLAGINAKTDLILLCEAREEYTHVKQHQKKIVFLLSAMRHFAKELKAQKFKIEYVALDDVNNTQSISSEIQRISQLHQADKIVITYPGEYRILQALEAFQQVTKIPLEIREDDRFLATRDEFAEWATDRKKFTMEFFYRAMRKKYQILMNGEQPVGGKWNYDKENRKFSAKMTPPPHYQAAPDTITLQAIKLVDENFSDHFGNIQPFYFGITHVQAVQALDLFINERLKNFGDYQDAMLENEPWMYHAHIGFYLNAGLLLPMECIERAATAYSQGKVSINSAEGFIRQILGWREYIRGIYWLKMPAYKNLNFFNAKRALPEFYWTANTNMNCLKQCVTETQRNAYAHHIQRLMVLGNFALLAGLEPKQVAEWFLIVFADAYEWAELPNVSGMALFADGGLLGSKPYAASGAYINKMSNYCHSCTYKVTQKNGADACPFNYLYWDFLIRNRSKLQNNQRLRMIYALLENMEPTRVKAIETDADRFFKQLQ